MHNDMLTITKRTLQVTEFQLEEAKNEIKFLRKNIERAKEEIERNAALSPTQKEDLTAVLLGKIS